MKQVLIGIYSIKNLINNKTYIGQSIDILDRWSCHKSALRGNRHTNIHLQNSWNKHTEELFVFDVVEICSPEILNEREQYHIDNSRNKLYNIVKSITEIRNYDTHTVDIKEQISKASKNHWQDPEYQDKVSDAIKRAWQNPHSNFGNRLPPTEEQKQKTSQTMKKRLANDEAKKKMRDSFLNTRECTICGCKYTTTSHRALVCSKECKLQYRRNRRCKPKYSGKLTYKNFNPRLPTLVFLAGQSGCGKTWVANQLSHKFTTLSHDKNRWEDLSMSHPLPVLFESPMRISTFINQNKDKFNIRFIMIQESVDTIKQRIANRGGSRLKSVESRNLRMSKIIDIYKPEFVGTSEQVYNYLK